jgi:hypothetical protein
MAALLKFAPAHGILTAAETIARLSTAVQASLSRQADARPTLVCRWLQDADGRLSCHWEFEVPAAIPSPDAGEQG